MRSLKARVVTATGTRVRNVRVEVKPVIKSFAATPAKPTPQKVTAPTKPTPQPAASGPPPMRPTRPPQSGKSEPRPRRRSTNPRPNRTRKTRP
jgi:hypothetical protein